MDILAMKEKRGQLWQEAKTFLDEHTDKDGKISAEDATTYDRMEAEITALGDNIRRFENQAAMDLQLAAPTSQPILPTLNAAKTGRASNEYRQAALTALRTNFRQISNILQEGVDPSGGYLVPTEWDTQLVKVLDEENVFRRLAKVITTSGEHKINILTNRTVAYVIAEGAPITPSDMTFTQKTLDAHKIAVSTQVTNELLFDNAYNLENEIINDFGRALGALEEDLFLNGDGNGKPTGLLTTAMADSDCVITTAGAAISADDIINLTYALKRPYRARAAFLMNDSTLAAIRKLKDSTQNFLWQPSFQLNEPEKLAGYPVYTSAYFPTVAAGKAAIVFGDFSGYRIGDRGARWFMRQQEKYSDTFSTGFVMVERVDGILVENEKVKILKMKG